MSPELWKRIPPEAQAIFVQMAETIARLERRVAELEARVQKTPQNSSLPPSTEHPHAKPPREQGERRSRKKRGGQPGHPKHERPLLPPEQCQAVVALKPDTCRRCDEALSGSDPEPLRHQVWEIPEIKPLVTEYQLHRLKCPAWLSREHLRPASDRRTGQSGRAPTGGPGGSAHGLLPAE
jgi:transposase